MVAELIRMDRISRERTYITKRRRTMTECWVTPTEEEPIEDTEKE